MDDPSDILSLLSGTEQTPQQKALAMAQALRGAGGGASDFARLGQLSGDKVLSNFGSGLIADDQQQQHLIGQAQDRGLQRALMAEKAKQEETYRNAMVANNTRQTDLKEKGTWVREGVGANGNFIDRNTLTNESRDSGVRAQPKPPPGARGQTEGQAEKEWTDLTNRVSTVSGRGNLNKENQQRVNNAERLEALVLGPGGQIQNLTPQQVREAGTALAALISSGAMSEHQISELTPSTLSGQWASLKQKVLNEPQGADAQKFLQNMLETAAREKAVVMKQIRAGQMQSLPNYMHLRGKDQARFEGILRGAGIDPAGINEGGLPIAAPAAGTLDPKRAARLEVLRKMKAAGTLK